MILCKSQPSAPALGFCARGGRIPGRCSGRFRCFCLTPGCGVGDAGATYMVDTSNAKRGRWRRRTERRGLAGGRAAGRCLGGCSSSGGNPHDPGAARGGVSVVLPQVIVVTTGPVAVLGDQRRRVQRGSSRSPSTTPAGRPSSFRVCWWPAGRSGRNTPGARTANPCRRSD